MNRLLTDSGTRCYTGLCKVIDTIGCKRNCDYVFHTVGPKVEDTDMMDIYEGLLSDCYTNCLEDVILFRIKSIVFPCISTGIFNFPRRKAAHTALNAVRSWLETYHSEIEQIVFCTYEDQDFEIYKEIMSKYFPISDKPIPGNKRPEEKDVENNPVNENVVKAVITES